MNSFRRGFLFLQQSWQMALKDTDLIQPSIMALIVGFVVTLIGSIPVILAFTLLGDSGIGQAVGYVLGALLIFVQFCVTYIFSAMTIYLVYQYLSEGDGRPDQAWTIVRRDFVDILSLAAASTAVNLLKSLLRGRGRNVGGDVISGLLGALWTEATYLILPAMVVEDIGLKDGIRRAAHIVRENLLLVGVSMVGVQTVTGLIGFLLGATGIGLGLGAGLGLVSLSGANTLGGAFGIGLGVLIALFFILVGVVIGSYTATAYHTCLYLWARDVEKAQGRGQDASSVTPPAPLAAALQ